MRGSTRLNVVCTKYEYRRAREKHRWIRMYRKSSQCTKGDRVQDRETKKVTGDFYDSEKRSRKTAVNAINLRWRWAQM